jgi:glycosyltransferase involved in cell wall biosynthesis
VQVHGLGAARVREAGFSLLRLVRRLKPQLILSGMFHLNFLVLLMRPLFPNGTRVLVRQNGTVSAALGSARVPRATRTLYRMLYPRVDALICQSAAMAEDVALQIAISLDRIFVLRNPVDIERIRTRAARNTDGWSGPGPHLLAMGRCAHEKGFDLLILSLAQVRERFVNADLLLAGTGPEESSLKALCRQLRLEAAVHFAGHMEDPSALFPAASLFVLPSRQEGMPNAMLEAAAAGLPIVATPASGGIVDLLGGQPGTWLTSEISAAALATAIEEALSSLQPAQRFPHEFLEPFALGSAIRAYEDLIDRTLSLKKTAEMQS